MCFSQHYNDVTDTILHDKCGVSESVVIFGVDSDYNTVSFWADSMLSEGMVKKKTTLANPMYVEAFEYDFGDVSVDTQYVGYAVEHGYDSVIIDSGESKNYILFDNDILSYVKDGGFGITEAKKAPAKGIKAEVLLKNTGKLSPARVNRGMREVSTNPPKITGASELAGTKYFRAEYNFKSVPSVEFRRQWGYADVSKDKKYVKQLYCTCKDFYYRLYAPYIAAGLATWDLPPKFKKNRQSNIVSKSKNSKNPVNTWTDKTNPDGKLFLCKHLWSFIAYYISGAQGSGELSDDEIDDIVTQFFGDYQEDDENSMETKFQKKYGKLYKRKAGKAITQKGTNQYKRKKNNTDEVVPDDVESDDTDSDEEVDND